MGIEAFPEIENFQKLPRQVIVKGGSSTFDEHAGAELRGIIINNIGHSIQEIRILAVIFDEKRLPVLSASTVPDPDFLPQGGIGSFTFQLKSYPEKIIDCHLFANWKFDERE